MKNRFPVIPIIPTKHGTAYVDAAETADNNDPRLFILYDYIAGDEPDPRNTEKVGELIGQFHQVMSQYPGKACCKGQAFFHRSICRNHENKTVQHGRGFPRVR